MTIEELTKQELIDLIRRLNPELDEEAVLYEVLMGRREMARENREKAWKSYISSHERICQLSPPFSSENRSEYEKLMGMRRFAWEEYSVWAERQGDAEKKMREIRLKALEEFKRVFLCSKETMV